MGYPVPLAALADWQIAELLVNGGEYQTMIRETCMNCAGTGRR